jgi:hypothetical protein
MNTYKIAENIIEVLKIPKQKKKETLNEFKIRLVEAMDQATDNEFDQLTTETQAWIESSVDVMLQDKPDTVLPPFPEESKAERDSDPTVVDTDSGVRIRQRKADALTRKPKESSQWHMKVLIAKNPNINHIALRNELQKLGFEVTKSTCYGILSNFRQSMKVLQSLNMLSPYLPS